MNRVYLDYQLIIDNVDGRSYGVDLSKIDKEKFEIVYSPAHIEEIANGNLNNKLKEPLSSYLSFLSCLTNNKELIYGYANTYAVISNIFDRNCGLLLVSEEPILCYNRVVKYIHKNDISKRGQSEVFSRTDKLFDGLNDKALSKKKTKINNLNILEVLYSQNVKQRLLTNVVDTFIANLSQENLIRKGIPINDLKNEDFIYLVQ